MRPVLLELAGTPLHAYGLCLGAALVLGTALAAPRAVRAGVPEGRFYWLAFLCALAGVVGGRLDQLLQEPEVRNAALAFRHGGRTAWGGFAGALVAAVVGGRALSIPFWKTADAASPALGLGVLLTRIGCFLAGCDWGIPATGALAPLGVAFPGPGPGLPRGSLPWRDHLERGLIGADAPASLPLVPVQLLEAAVGVFALVLAYSMTRRPRREGSAFLAFFVVYGLARLGLEALRDDPGRGDVLGLSSAQVSGLAAAAVAGAALFVPALAQRRPEVPAEAAS